MENRQVREPQPCSGAVARTPRQTCPRIRRQARTAIARDSYLGRRAEPLDAGAPHEVAVPKISRSVDYSRRGRRVNQRRSSEALMRVPT